MITTKLAIKIAKYAFLQAPSHLGIWLQAPGGILQLGSHLEVEQGEVASQLKASDHLVLPLQQLVLTCCLVLH